MRMRTTIIPALLLAFAACSGCVSTSEPFKVGAAAAGPFLADTTRQYVDKDSAISPDVKSQRLADITALSNATAVKASIDSDVVESAWNNVKPTFYLYTNSDPSLSRSYVAGQPTLRSIIQAPAVKLDAAISEEKARRAKFRLIPSTNP